MVFDPSESTFVKLIIAQLNAIPGLQAHMGGGSSDDRIILQPSRSVRPLALKASINTIVADLARSTDIGE